MAAMPFTLGGNKLVVGLGAVEYANMNFYYQDNNVLSPAVNIQRPFPVELVTNDSNALPVQWYQNIRNREGSVYGYGAAISVRVMENLAFGLSGMIIKGSTNDFESQLGRGRLVFYSHYYFRLDSVDYQNTKIGTSDYSGAELNFSGTYKSQNLTFGFSIKPPTSITRDYKYSYQNDSLKVSKATAVSGSDKIKLPWRGTFGLSVSVLDNLRAVLEYELRPMGSANYIIGGVTTNPWKSSHLLHIGAEYAPLDWLTIRGGYSDKAEVFEQEGNPFQGDPVYSNVISGGLGLTYENLKLNLTYEYSNVKYDDLLQQAVFLNNSKNNYIVAEIVYNLYLPWSK
jgi:opacity protein-like surface antigen